MTSLRRLDHFNADAFEAAHESESAPVSIHLNPGKPVPDTNDPVMSFSGTSLISGKVPWAPDAYYLSERPSFTLDPLFHAGAYYVQEASGMFLAHALKTSADLSRKLNVLDLCAAPGGKSTLIQSLISPGSMLVSNEVIKSRTPVLLQNMTKWGHPNSFVSHDDPAHFKALRGFFDVLLIDAPCSGSGLFRKDPNAAHLWNPELVNLCHQRQQRIVADAWESLKEDGILIYCTCSYSKEENEDIVDSIFQQHDCRSIRLAPDANWQIVETISEGAGAHGYRFYPDRLAGEGFFLSVMQKKEACVPERVYRSVHSPNRISKEDERLIMQWTQNGSYGSIAIGDAIHVFPAELMNDLETIRSKLYLKKAGIRMGKSAGKEWIPDHELALAILLKNPEQSIDLSLMDAQRFLRGEPFESGTTEKGWCLARHRGLALGWVKLLDRRMNNYYPKSWRIRM